MVFRPISLGKLKLSSNVAYSPLAGCSDLPYRLMATLYRPGLFFCEMIKADALVRNDPNTFRLLDFTPNMHPIGAQVCGSKTKLVKEAAKICEDLGFDVVDFNCGCPVDKVTKDGSGSGMLKEPERIGEILAEMISVVSIPVTVKIRIGWDDASIIAPQVVQIAEKAGAKIIFIHGRTREQAYHGPARWEPIKEAKAAAKEILVFGNGDVFSGAKAEQMFNETGCDGVLVSRGTLGKPWLHEEIRRHLLNLPPIEETGAFFKEELLKHFTFTKAYQGERQAVVDMRRIGCWYLRALSGAKELRETFNRAKSLAEIEHAILNYHWDVLFT